MFAGTVIVERNYRKFFCERLGRLELSTYLPGNGCGYDAERIRDQSLYP